MIGTEGSRDAFTEYKEERSLAFQSFNTPVAKSRCENSEFL